MSLPRLLTVALACLLLPLEALADDDLLAPLTPDQTKPKKKKKVKKAAPAAEKQEDEVLAPLVARTELAVKVEGELAAKLFVDGVEVAALPSPPVEIEPGERLVVVKRTGFADAVRRITVKAGEREELTLALDPIAGVLNVVADAAGARVIVNGKDEGQAPLTDFLLVPGNHEVKVTAEGYAVERSRLQVRAGREYNISAKLRRSAEAAVASADSPRRTDLAPEDSGFEPEPLVATAPPAAAPQAGPPQWYQRWYVWAGGAAVAGAIAGGIAVATQPPDLSRNPGASVCGGACDGVLGTPGFR